jgi:hypothetical protein
VATAPPFRQRLRPGTSIHFLQWSAFSNGG